MIVFLFFYHCYKKYLGSKTTDIKYLHDCTLCNWSTTKKRWLIIINFLDFIVPNFYLRDAALFSMKTDQYKYRKHEHIQVIIKKFKLFCLIALKFSWYKMLWIHGCYRE